METKQLKPLLLRVEEVAQLLAIGRSTVYELIASGQLPSVKVGGARRVPMVEIERWVRENTHGQA